MFTRHSSRSHDIVQPYTPSARSFRLRPQISYDRQDQKLAMPFPVCTFAFEDVEAREELNEPSEVREVMLCERCSGISLGCADAREREEDDALATEDMEGREAIDACVWG